MIGRAVTAFRKSVTKSNSSNTLADANEENVSIISDDSQSVNVRSYRSDSETSRVSSNRLLWLKKQRRSQSVNREGDRNLIDPRLKIIKSLFKNKYFIIRRIKFRNKSNRIILLEY